MTKKFTFFKNGVRFLLGTVLALTSMVSDSRAQTTIINPTGDGGFETGTTFAANGWTVVNNASATMNNWVLSTGATGYSGARAAYVSNNSGTPPTHTYDNAVQSAVHLYRDVTFPSGETNISFSFSSKQNGEVAWDQCHIYISTGAPGAAPVAGTPSSATAGGLPPVITGYTYLYTVPVTSAFATQNVPITAAQAGNASAASTRRILFIWHNDDNTGGDPPIALDNISLVSSCVPTIAGLTTTAIGTTTATLSWGTVTGATSYNVRYKKTTDLATVPTWATPTNSVGTSLPITGLTSSTLYEFQVSAVGSGICAVYSGSANFKTACTGPTITASAGATRCGLGTLSLTATPSTGATLKWYTTAVGGTPVATTSPYVTPPISVTTSYYVAAATQSTTYTPFTLGAGALTTTASGTSSTNYVSPYGHYYGGYKAQYIIRASELLAAGVSPGNINSIAFDVTSTGTTYAGFEIGIAATSTTTAAAFIAGLTPVYSGAPTPTVGINTYTFSTPFNWDGASNIVVGLCWSNNNGGGAAAEVKYDATSYAATAYHRFDNNTPALMCGTATPLSTLLFRPKMVFGNAPVCEGPRTLVNATITTAPAITITSPQFPGICTGGTASITASSSNSGYGYSWTPGAATTATISVTPATATTYVVTALDAATGCTAKDSIRLLVSPVPGAPTVTPTAAPICMGNYVTLTATTPSSSATGIVGTGTLTNTNTSFPTPFGNYWGSNHEQYLIRATELTAAGISAGNINSVAFNQAVGYTYAAMKDYTLKIAHTSQTAMASAFQATGFTTVYTNASYSPPAAAGWATTAFSTPFAWDGVSNIIVDVTFLNCTTCNGTSTCATTYTNNGVVNQTATAYQSTYGVYYDDNCTIPTFAPTGTFLNYTNMNQRPNMQFVASGPQFPVKWTPVTGLYKNTTLTTAMSAADTNKVVYASPTATTVYSVVTTNNGCSSTAATSTVTVFPAQPTTITANGALTFCEGSNVLLTTVAGTGFTYQWFRNGVAITTAGTSQSYSATTTGAYTVAINNGNCVATSVATNVTVNPKPTASVTMNPTNGTICGGTVALTAATSTGVTYQWYKDGTIIPGATGSTYAASTGGVYTIVVTNTTTTCTATSTGSTVIVVAPPVAAITPSGPVNLCQNDTLTLAGNTGTGFTYQWKRGAVNATGTSTGSTYNATQDGSYTLVVTANGCSTTSAATTITIQPLPLATMTPTAPVTSCDSVLFSTNNTGVSFQWIYNNLPIAGANSSTYAAPISGSYSLRTTSLANGCSAKTAPVTVTVNPSPSAVTTYTLPLTFCTGGAVVLNVSSGASETYEWRRSNTPIAGANGTSLVVDSSGSISIKVVNTITGCTKISTPLLVQVNPLPMPVVEYIPNSNIMRTTQPYSLYQWSLNNQPIGGATQRNYSPLENGAYNVYVTDSNGCQNQSGIRFINNVGVKHTAAGAAIKIYPNPTNGNLYVKSPMKVNLSLRDVTGKTVLKGDDKTGLNLENLADGMYLLYVTDEANQLIRAEKVTKTNR